MGVEFQNPKFNVLRKITFIFFYKMPIFWSTQVNIAIPGQVKVAK